MRMSIRVVPKASRTAVKQENGVLKVYLTRPAQDGQANAQLIEVLAGHWGVKKYRIAIVAGHAARNKIVEISPQP